MLNIKTTPHEFTYNYSKQVGNSVHGEYMYHIASASNEIIICDENDCYKLFAHYSTGNSFHHLDYDCPMNKLELDDDFSNRILVDLNEFHHLDFEEEHNLENLDDLISDVQEIIPAIKTIDDLYELYLVLMDNVPRLNDYLDDDVYTDDINDYEPKPKFEEYEGIYQPKGFNRD